MAHIRNVIFLTFYIQYIVHIEICQWKEKEE